MSQSGPRVIKVYAPGQARLGPSVAAAAAPGAGPLPPRDSRARWRGRSRALAGAFFLVAAASVWQVVAPQGVRAAQTDLSFTSASTWTADPVAARVHVQAVITATSHTVDSGTRRYFYDQLQLTLPPSAASFAASSASNQELPVTVQSVTSSSVIIVVGLGQRLYAGQSGTVFLKFDLIDTGGSTDRDLRIGHDLMSFPVWAFGSPGTPGSSVNVIFPSDFTVQEEFGGLTRTVFGSGEVMFSSGALADATALSAWFTAVEPVPPSDFRVRTLTIGPLNVALRYWADDVGWADQVERVLRAGYPLLRDMIGIGDPNVTALTVEEASTQEIGGFSGAYDAGNGQVLVSYFADPFVILHEAAHMWFNGGLVADRWIQEGFASYYAQAAVDRLGFVDHAPVLTSRIRQNAVPLNDWVTGIEPNSAVDAYQYAASLEAARQIAALAGQEGLAAVWRAAHADAAAYQPVHGTPNETLTGGQTDWRRLLDLLEQNTGRSYQNIWRLWIIDPSQASLLQQRATALADYSVAQNTAGDWDLPPEIRRSLDFWQFDQAIAFIAQAQTVLSQRDQIARLSALEQTTPPPTLRAAFEDQGIAAAIHEASTEAEVLSELSGARLAQVSSDGAARDVGLFGVDPQADLSSAREAFAQGDMTRAMTLAANARSAWQGAAGAGQIRILGSLSVFVGCLLLLGVFVWTRRSRWREGSSGHAAELAASAEPASSQEAALSSVASGIGALTASLAGGRTAEAAWEAAGATGTASGAAGVSGAGAASGVAGVSGGIPTEAAAPRQDTAATRLALAAGSPEGGPSGRHDEGEIDAEAARDLADARDEAASGEPADGSDRAERIDDCGAEPDESAYDLLQRGHALLRDRHNAQAAVVLERAARLERSKGSILEALGRAYFNSGQHARAAETFEELLEIDPSAHYGHFALGLSFARLGRDQEARTHLKLAVALDPASDTYRRALEKIDSPKK